jgi:hypothetical protein
MVLSNQNYGQSYPATSLMTQQNLMTSAPNPYPGGYPQIPPGIKNPDPLTPPMPLVPPIPQQNLMGHSVEQQALNGGGAGNKQQISNFMSALNNVGAGSNNTFMNANPAQAGGAGPLISPNAASANNGQIGQIAQNQNYMTTPGAPTFGDSPQFNGNSQPMSQSDILATPAGLPQVAPPLAAIAPISQPSRLIPATPPAGIPKAAPPLAGKPFDSMTNYRPLISATPPAGLPQAAPPLAATAPVVSSLIPATPPPGLSQRAPPSFSLASDENLKTNISPSDDRLKQFMSSIGAHSYQYKNPQMDGEGTFVSPMAQELERTELGKQAVIDTPRGKMVNYPRLGAVNLAGLSVLNQETKKLQEKYDRLQSQFEEIQKGFKL